MYKPTYGDPVYTVRLPKPTIAALKMFAKDMGCSTSVIVRDLVEEELKEHGYTITEKPIDGQMVIE